MGVNVLNQKQFILRWPSGKPFASGAVNSSFIPNRVKPITTELIFTASLLHAQH